MIRAIYRSEVPSISIMNRRKAMEIGKVCRSNTFTVKREEFHTTRMPPDAPTDGTYSNLSNLLGTKFPM
jgi:hypothetical protein